MLHKSSLCGLSLLGLVPEITQTCISQELQRRASPGKRKCSCHRSSGRGRLEEGQCGSCGEEAKCTPPCPTLHIWKTCAQHHAKEAKNKKETSRVQNQYLKQGLHVMYISAQQGSWDWHLALSISVVAPLCFLARSRYLSKGNRYHFSTWQKLFGSWWCGRELKTQQ